MFLLLRLFVATMTIFARCVYRCIELSGGFQGELFVSDEPLYMVLEGVMMIIACTCLTFLHPGLCFQGTWREATFSWRIGKNSTGINMEMVTSDEASRQSTVYEGMLPSGGIENVQKDYSNREVV